MLVGQFEQGAGPHRPGEVQMQMCLGQQANLACRTYLACHSKILLYDAPARNRFLRTGACPNSPNAPDPDRPAGQSRASPSSFWSRATPSTRSSSPSA